MVVVLGEAVDRRDILSTRCNMFATMHPGLARTLETQTFFGQQFFLKAIGGVEFLPPPSLRKQCCKFRPCPVLSRVLRK